MPHAVSSVLVATNNQRDRRMVPPGTMGIPVLGVAGRGICETLGAGLGLSTCWIWLHGGSDFLNSPSINWKLASLITAFAVFAIVRWALRIVVWIALPMSALTMVHPLVQAASRTNASDLPPTSVAGPLTPLELVDRSAWTSTRLSHLPQDLAAIRIHTYLGWSLILLSYVAVFRCPTTTPSSRRTYILTLACFASLWLLRGSSSLHSQLIQLFEYATCRRYVDPTSLNLIGLLMIPLVFLGAVLYQATAKVVDGTRRRSFGAVLIASLALMVWWATSPPIISLWNRLGPFEWIIHLIVAATWIAIGSVGVQHLVNLYAKITWQLPIFTICLLAVLADIQGFSRPARDGEMNGSRHRSAQFPHVPTEMSGKAPKLAHT